MIDLTPGTKERLRTLFRPEDLPEAERLLANDDTAARLAGQGWTPAQLERIQFAALRASGGSLDGLRNALVVGRTDWRDLVMSAGFGHDPLAHQSWQPGPGDAVPSGPRRPGSSLAAGPRWEDLPPDDSPLRSRQIEVEGVSLHVLEGGAPGRKSVLFLGGGSGSLDAFVEVMRELRKGFCVVALDFPNRGGIAGAPDADDTGMLARFVKGTFSALGLPGRGRSADSSAADDPRTLARYVKGAIAGLGLEEVTLVGHGPGGQIVYAYLHAYPGELKRVVILSAAVPTGEENLAVPGKPVTTPVLLVRGEKEPGDLNAYAAGFRAGGLQTLRTAALPGAGTSGPGEQPAALATMLRQYIAATP
jgi:predicted esterase